jgi:hypothetical protein
VGWRVGAVVGDGVGPIVGIDDVVGPTVGSGPACVGVSVGVPVGEFVGVSVGVPVGEFVGSPVGLEVGEDVDPSAPETVKVIVYL